MNRTNSLNLPAKRPYFSILIMIGCAHLLNDLIQSMLTATYPLLESKYALTFAQIGMISLVYQVTASILQPAIGFYTDKRPKPYLLPFGMMSTTLGIIILSFANQFYMMLFAAAFMGVGSSVFHPEASRLTRSASGGRFGFAQSVFQVGGNLGSAFGPLLAGLVVVKYARQSNILWFTLFGFIAIILLFKISSWSAQHQPASKRRVSSTTALPFGKRTTILALSVLALLIFSKYFYMSSMSNFYTFYLIQKFGLPRDTAVILLFVFLASVAIGTFVGGPIGDRIGRRYVIWFSILGAAPFTLLLPYANLPFTIILTIFIGLIISSAFSAIVVFAQELVPGHVGMIAGVFFGFMFGMSGIAAAVLGYTADHKGLYFVFKFCAFLPLLGVFTIFLPKIEYREKGSIN